MSVLIPDVDVFSYVRCGLTKTALNRVVDEFYSYSVQKHFRDKGTDQIFNESIRLVKSWCRLNERSYVAAYRHHGESFDDLSEFITEKQYDVEAVQLVKYLQCIDYNIEDDTIQEDEAKEYQLTEQDKADLKLLRAWIPEVNAAIVHQLPKYEEANWSNFEDRRKKVK